MHQKIFWLTIVLAALACGRLDAPTALPTYTLYPTYTPLPTLTPWPTYTPFAVSPHYQIVDLAMTWEEAKLYCATLGGRLATVSTPEAQQALVSLLTTSGTKNVYWLGGKLEGSQWKWVTGENFSVTYWAPGEPTHLSPEERYLAVFGKNLSSQRTGSWADNFNEGWNGDYTLDKTGVICEPGTR